MKTKITTCLECNNVFEAQIRELNRGNAKFCSRNCAAYYRNKHLKIFNYICKQCGNKFSSKAHFAEYCSDSCKQKSYRKRSKSGNPGDRKLLKDLSILPCSICNYIKSPRDIHHIIDVSKEGKTIITNLITLCPNCHREVHSNLISQDELLKLIKFRTISSSSNEEQDAFSNKD